MKLISVVTLGCKVNQYDTAAILNELPSSKYERNRRFTDRADIYIIDTCTVTHKADSEARNYISKARKSNPEGVVVVTGCYAQVSSEELSKIDGVDYIVGNSHKFRSLLNIIRNGTVQQKPVTYLSDIFSEKKKQFSTPDIDYFPDRTRAFLKVQDGCNYACTFCIIPRARGRSRSLSADEILKRIGHLADNGYREIVLTGIHLASYGKDIGTDLLSLLMCIDSHKLINNIRLSSLDPADINEDLIEFCAEAETICPSFHISLQSGDEVILKKMRRRYRPDDFTKCTDLIRHRIPDASIGTDLMVGFPGEGEMHFENTYKVARDSALTYFHVFPYSKRKHTPATAYTGQVDPGVKKERSKRLRKLGELKKKDFYGTFVGRELRAIVETGSGGTTRNYINFKFRERTQRAGEEIDIRIIDIEDQKAVAIPLNRS